MNRETLSLIQSRGPERLKVLEISGSFWKDRCGFREYHTVSYPDYDVTLEPLPDTFDLIIAEQVLEHIPWPSRAVRNIFQMLNPGGAFLVTTPFLLKLHEFPARLHSVDSDGNAVFSRRLRVHVRENSGLFLGKPELHLGQLRALANLSTLASFSRE